VDRETARRYVEAAQAAGLSREAGVDAVDDELVGVVVEAVRPDRLNGHGELWEALEACHDQIQLPTHPWEGSRLMTNRPDAMGRRGSGLGGG